MLTPAQEATLREFIEVTQLQNDIALAESLLVSVEWKLEDALSLHFDGNQAPPESAYPGSASRIHGAPSMSLMDELNQDLTTSQAPRTPPEPVSRDIPAESVLAAFLRPIYLGARMLNGLFCLFGWIFPFLPRLIGYSTLGPASNSIGPKQRAHRHLDWFKEAFCAHDVQFFEGGYLDALSKSKEELRYLILIITSSDHVDMPAFAKVISNPKFLDYVSSKNILVWAGSVKDSEGYQLANGLEVTSFPFLGFVAPSPKTSQSNTVVMASLLKKNGYDGYTTESLVRSFDELMEEHSPKILALELDRRQRDSAREIRSEQDAAYERSLQQDRARQVEIQRLSSIQEDEARRVREEETARLLYVERLEQWKSWKAFELSTEPPVDGSTRVSIRLNTGERVIRRFNASDSVRTIYEFVMSHGAEPSCVELTDFEPVFDFCLVSPMPRMVVELSDTAIVEVPAIWPNGTLVVDEPES